MPLCVSTCLQTFNPHCIFSLMILGYSILLYSSPWATHSVVYHSALQAFNHMQSHLEGTDCVNVCECLFLWVSMCVWYIYNFPQPGHKLACDQHYMCLSLHVITLPLCLSCVSLSVTKCLIRVMRTEGGKFPLWVRKYKSTDNILSDRSHPVSAEVCARVYWYIRPKKCTNNNMHVMRALFRALRWFLL